MSILNITLPEYEATLPITGKKVKYRPFVTKEEKILLLAQEEGQDEGIINAINQIFKLCTFDQYSIENLNKVDAEYLFIQLRNKSIGENIDVNGICKKCDGRTRLTLDMSQVKVIGKDSFKTKFQLSDDLWAIMRLPMMKDSMELPKNSDETLALAMALETIIDKDNSYNAAEYSLAERKDFFDSLTKIQLKKMDGFFSSFPILTYDIDYTCTSCKEQNHVHLEGIESFFV